MPDAKFTETGRLAQELSSEIKNFRSSNSKGSSAAFHKAKVLQKELGIDPTGMSPAAIEEQLAMGLSKIFEQMNLPGNMEASQLRLKLNKLKDAFPELVDLIDKGQQQGEYFGLAKIKAGGATITLGDMARRYGAIFPVELGASIANNPLVKVTGQATNFVANKAILNAPSNTLKGISVGLEKMGAAKAANMMSKLSDTTDEGKKRAILNMINQMPSVKKAVSNQFSSDEE